jgi:UDP-glucose 4-epimerase
VFRPRQTREYAGIISVFLKQARDGRELIVHGDGEQTRGFVSVADVVQANLLAGTTGATGMAFTIGADESISIRGPTEEVQSLSDTPLGIRHESAREGDIDRSEANIEQARDEVGFAPAYELSEGLAQMW